MGAIGGKIRIQANGIDFFVKSKFTYNFGLPKKTLVVGADQRVHGYKEEPQAGFVKGTITDDGSVDLTALVGLTDATITLYLSTGKTAALYQAVYSGDGTGDTEEGEFPFEFEGIGQEIPSTS